MPAHLTEEQLEAYNRKRLPVDEMLAADEHLAACESCYGRFRGDDKLDQLFRFVQTDLTEAENEASQCLSFEDISAFVNRQLSHEEYERVDGHLALCQECEELARDLAQISTELDPTPVAPAQVRAASDRGRKLSVPLTVWAPLKVVGVIAAAALLIAVITAGLFLKRLGDLRQEVTEVRQENDALRAAGSNSEELRSRMTQIETMIADLRNREGAPAEISLNDEGRNIVLDREGNLSGLGSVPAGYLALVKNALISEQIPLVLPRLPYTGHSGTQRGVSSEGKNFKLRTPVGIAVLSRQPTFKWQPLAGAEKYVVFVRDLTSEDEIRSEPISVARWTVTEPLVRGHAYAWAVEAHKKGERIQSPAPQSPEAKFKVIESAKADELSVAKNNSGGSHLLMAILYAKHGLAREAAAELQRLKEQNPNSRILEKFVRNFRPTRR